LSDYTSFPKPVCVVGPGAVVAGIEGGGATGIPGRTVVVTEVISTSADVT
jgi:hypothetical protein